MDSKVIVPVLQVRRKQPVVDLNDELQGVQRLILAGVLFQVCIEMPEINDEAEATAFLRF